MISRFRLAPRVVLAIAAVCGAGAVQAQIVRVRPGGVYVRAPYAPPVAVNLRGVVPGVPLVRPYLLPRRRALLAAPYGALGAPAQPPTPGNVGPLSEAPRYTPGATRASTDSPSADRTFPIASELATFDDGTLLNAVIDAATALDAELGRFDTGAGWQKYLRLPEDALPPPSAEGHVTLGFKSIETTLERLNSVAANPDYAMIARLPSFVATQAALSEVVARFGPQARTIAAGSTPPVNATSAEELPMPQPTLAAPSTAGQRSILGQ